MIYRNGEERSSGCLKQARIALRVVLNPAVGEGREGAPVLEWSAVLGAVRQTRTEDGAATIIPSFSPPPSPAVLTLKAAEGAQQLVFIRLEPGFTGEDRRQR